MWTPNAVLSRLSGYEKIFLKRVPVCLKGELNVLAMLAPSAWANGLPLVETFSTSHLLEQSWGIRPRRPGQRCSLQVSKALGYKEWCQSRPVGPTMRTHTYSLACSGWIVTFPLRKRYVHVFIHGTCQCELIWKRCHCIFTSGCWGYWDEVILDYKVRPSIQWEVSL